MRDGLNLELAAVCKKVVNKLTILLLSVVETQATLLDLPVQGDLAGLHEQVLVAPAFALAGHVLYVSLPECNAASLIPDLTETVCV